MQQPFMFIDYGDGWKNVNSHLDSVAAVSSFTINWGVDKLGDQPDPAVMSFTLRDSTGALAGNSITLAGARIIVQISREPLYSDMPAVTYASLTCLMKDYHSTYRPRVPSKTDSRGITIFDGIIATGGSVEKTATAWLVRLSASSRMILYKRSQSLGNTSAAAKYNGLHWVGTPAQRLAEIKKRIIQANAPELDTSGFTLPSAVASYEASTFPTLLDLLHRLYASHEHLPMWCEYPHRDSSIIKAFPTMRPVAISMQSDGSLSLLDRGEKVTAIDAADVIIDDQKLTLPDPTTQIVVKTKRAAFEDNKLNFDDVDVTFSSATIPKNLTVVQSSLTIDSDVVSVDNANGQLDGRAWAPSENERSVRSRDIEQINTRLQPEKLIFDSRKIDAAERPDLFMSAPSHAYLIANSIYQTLASHDGYPLAIAPFMIIGGTISFRFVRGDPVIFHEATPISLPRYPLEPSYADMGTLAISYKELTVPCSIFSIINQYE